MLQGADALRTRLKALKVAFKPVGRAWAEETVRQVRPRVPRRTGRGAASVRVRNASQTKATVSAVFYVGILDKGAKAHDEVPRKAKALRFQASGNTIFSKKVHKPRQEGKHFAAPAAKEALRKNPMADELIKQWNQAA